MLYRSPVYKTHIYSIPILQSSFRVQHLAYASQVASHTHLGRVRQPSNLRYFSTIKPSRIFIPSPAQVAIVEACKTHNVIVSARPGSGKTATAEAIVRANPFKRIAIITYSKRLQVETQERLSGYKYVDVYTFHGMASRLFKTTVFDDNILNQLRKNKARPLWKPSYDLVILDEMQDLRDNLYWLTRVFITILNQSMRQKPRFIVMGDARQTIFQHRNADARYLELAGNIFSDISPYEWKHKELGKSFRLSHQTAEFVNSFIGEQYIEGSHDAPKPVYLHADIWDNRALLRHLLLFIKKYKPENTVILSPSVRRNQAIAQMTNKLSRLGILIAQPASDDAALDEDVLKGKITISSYHQFKGCERDLAIVFGVEESYFDVFGPSLNDAHCPNATFVALTRAKKQLIVIQSAQSSAMPFMPSETMQHAEYCSLVDWQPNPQRPPGRQIRRRLRLPEDLPVTEICSQLDKEKLHSLVRKYMHIKIANPALPDAVCIKADSKVCIDEEKRHYELVSDINGLAVTAAFEWERTGACTTFFRYPGQEDSKKLYGDMTVPEDRKSRARWFARKALEYDVKQGPYKSRYMQMKHHSFDWLDGHLEATTQRLSEQFLDSSHLTFEKSLSQEFRIEDPDHLPLPYHKVKIRGRVDIVDQGTSSESRPVIWEIKFTSTLRLEHVAQLAIYGYLWFMEREAKKNGVFPCLVLFNVQSGEKWEVITTQEDAAKFIEEVLRVRYTSSGEKETSKFLEECQMTNDEVKLAAGCWKVREPLLSEGKGNLQEHPAHELS